MTAVHETPQAQPRPYAALKPAPPADEAARPAHAPHPSADAIALASEIEKLESLKEALWSAFLSAPNDGLPTPLTDLVATYVSALRMKLSLASYSKRRVPAPGKAGLLHNGKG